MSPTPISQTDGGATASEADSEEEELSPVREDYKEQIDELKKMLTNIKPGKLKKKDIVAAMVRELVEASETEEAEKTDAPSTSNAQLLLVESQQTSKANTPHVDVASTSSVRFSQRTIDEPSGTESENDIDQPTTEEIEVAVEKSMENDMETGVETEMSKTTIMTPPKITLGQVRKGRSTIEIHFDNKEPPELEVRDPSKTMQMEQKAQDLDAADLLAEAEELARKIIYDSPRDLEIDLEATEHEQAKDPQEEATADAEQPEKLSTIPEVAKEKETDDSGQCSEQSGIDDEIQGQETDVEPDTDDTTMQEQKLTWMAKRKIRIKTIQVPLVTKMSQATSEIGTLIQRKNVDTTVLQ